MDPDHEAAPTEEGSTPADHPFASPGSTGRSIRPLSGQEWEVHREIIKDLYNRLPLKDVITYMREQYNFYANARMYKARLKQWGINKYVKSRDMKTLVYRMQSSTHPRLPMDLEIDGKVIPRARVERYAKRKGQALGRDAPVTSTTSINTDSPAPTDSIADDYILIDKAGEEFEVHTDDFLSPAPTGTPQATSPPAQTDQPSQLSWQHTAPLLSGMILGPSAESSEPTWTGSRYPFSQPAGLEGQLCPTAPRPRIRNLQGSMQTDTIQQALLLALILSAMMQQRPLGDLADVRMDALEQQATLDMNILTLLVDLLGWLQLHRQIVFLASIYLVRFHASPTFPKSHNVWQQLLVALKFSQNYLDDEPYSDRTWIHAIPHLANSSLGQTTLELDVLSDQHIRLHIDHIKWKLLTPRLETISTTLFLFLERGIFTFETTQQRSSGPMELTSSGFL